MSTVFNTAATVNKLTLILPNVLFEALSPLDNQSHVVTQTTTIRSHVAIERR